MSDAPFDVIKYFEATDGEDLELHEVFIQGADPDPGAWIAIADDYRRLDSTLLVLLYERAGVRRIAVKHEDRVVEFDLYDLILREHELVGVER